MFFKKKPKVAEPTNVDELRSAYRKRNSKAQSLEATLNVTGWPSLRVELIDLSVRGAGVRVPFAQDRNLKIGDVVELIIGSMMRGEVITGARVSNLGPHGESHVRYGLEFLNLGNLYSQLDSFYSRHFNRRRHLRVLPSLDRKIHALLRWSGGELKVPVFDISASGLGVVLSKDSAARTAEITVFDLEFKLPGRDETLRGRATARHRSPLRNNVLLGLDFDLSAKSSLQAQVPAIRQFVEQRTAEMALWEKNWG